nr:MAG TPA: hypothetical protein [Caudoviricetes sp.]
MSDYVTPTITCGNFTKGKHYEVFREYPGEGAADRVRINDDSGLSVIAFVGVPSSLLCYKGCFHRVSFETSDAISMSGVYRKEPIQNSEPFVFRDGRLCINKAKIGGAIMTSGALKPSGEDWVKRCERLQEQVNELIAVNEEVRKILRCPDGFDIRKQAQVVRTLADTLLAISK